MRALETARSWIRRRATVVTAGAVVGACLPLGTVAEAFAKSGVDPTRISKPSGPASVEGLGSSFTPALSTGTATYDVGIVVPPAAGGFSPELSLAYDGGAGVSELGMGWKLTGLPSIRRRVENGLPHFDDQDTFELSGLGVPCDLVPHGGYFRPRYETGTFARVSHSPETDTWEARDKSGVTYRFGGRGFTEAEGDDVATYLLREQEDRHGHVISYEWDTATGYALLQRVSWNAFSDEVTQEIRLSYEERGDTHVLFSSGIRRELLFRLSELRVTLGEQQVRRYRLAYEETPHSRLTSVEMFGADDSTALPTLTLGYTTAELASSADQLVSMQSPPGWSVNDPDVALADLNGDSLPDLLVGRLDGYRSYVNHDGLAWQPGRDWGAADSPSAPLSSLGVQLMDMDGDAAIDWVAKSGSDYFRYLPGQDELHFGPPKTFSRVPGFLFEDPDVRVADLDGDRRSDVVQSTAAGLVIHYNVGGEDWSEPTAIDLDPQQAPPRFSEPGTQLCDVNGDRVQDVCQLRSGSMSYWLGRGRGGFEPRSPAKGVPRFDEATDPWRLADLDGDGWLDLLQVGVTRVAYRLATAVGAFGEEGVISGTPARGETAIELADMNGSGTTDIVWADTPEQPEPMFRYLELFPRGRGGLLQHIDNGLGKVVTIEYEPAAVHAARARAAGKPWSTRINVGVPVVSRVSIDASLDDAPMVSTYTYRDGTWDAKERTFAGFAGATDVQLGDEHTPTLVTDTAFDTGLSSPTLRGAVLRVVQRDEHEAVSAETTRSYQTLDLGGEDDARHVAYSYVAREQVDHIEGKPDLVRSTLTEWVQDEFGNAIRELRWGEVEGENTRVGGDEALTFRQFVNDVNSWQLGFLVTEELKDARGSVVRATRKYYDGLPLGDVGARGDLTRTEAWIGPTPTAFELEAATEYNEDGQPLETTDARGGGRIYIWDPVDRTSLLSERVKLESDVPLVTSVTMDRAFGVPLSITGYNGVATNFRYDALGRLIKVIRHGDTEERPTLHYEYDLVSPLSRVRTSARVTSQTDKVEVREALVDGLGRPRGTLQPIEGERWVLGGVALFDARGNSWRALQARFVTLQEGEDPPLQEARLAGTTTWHDAQGRELASRSELGIETKTEYLPLGKRHWDGGQVQTDPAYEGTPTEERFDGLNRVVQATRVLDGAAVETSFEYDAAGGLLSRTDPEQNTSTYGYDGRGRRTSVNDPDLGERQFVWDATGNLLERRNPDGSAVRWTYDLAGRPLTEDRDGDDRPEVTTTWDSAPSGAANGRLYAGKMVKVVDPSGSTELEYDERERVTRTTIAALDGRYVTASRYDAQDRERLHVYPDGSAVRIRYDARGQVSAYGDAILVDYDATGLQTDLRVNTGVREHRAYDDDRRLSAIHVTAEDGGSVEHLGFVLDDAGNLRALVDQRGGISGALDRSETYDYDNLYRLVHAGGTWGETSWRYSPSGNLLARSSSIEEQDAPEIGYGDRAGPHAMTSYRDRRLQYDALGRMLDDGQRTLTWNALDQLTQVQAASGAIVKSTFDAGGKRRIRAERGSGGSTDTIFLDDWTEVRDGTLVRYIMHDGRRVARLAKSTGAAKSSDSPRLVDLQRREPPLVLLLFGACMLLYWRLAEPRRRRARLATTLTALLVFLGCNDSPCPNPMPPGEPPDEGTVTALGTSDTLLFHDQIGSLLSETNGAGVVQGSFAAYPYGFTRYDTTQATQRYANTPRDVSVDLDHMGARFYAPDLGVWTAGDPILSLSSSPQGSLPTTMPAYNYARNSPLVSVDPTGFLPEDARFEVQVSRAAFHPKISRVTKARSAFSYFLEGATSADILGGGTAPRHLARAGVLALGVVATAASLPAAAAVGGIAATAIALNDIGRDFANGSTPSAASGLSGVASESYLDHMTGTFERRRMLVSNTSNLTRSAVRVVKVVSVLGIAMEVAGALAYADFPAEPRKIPADAYSVGRSNATAKTSDLAPGYSQ